MFQLAIIVGIYSYSVFFLGVLGYLYFYPLLLLSLVFLCIAVVVLKQHVFDALRSWKHEWKEIQMHPLAVFCCILLVIQGIVNLIGAAGPELGFDALWYHLTLPKIYMTNHAIGYIPGGLLYYSVMPKLIEMLYIPALLFSNEIAAKLIHFTFGILIVITLYKFAREFVNTTLSLLILIIFYSNLVVAWESITAYIDLGRTFYELFACYAFILWYKRKEFPLLVLSAVLIGFAITAKVLALGSLGMLWVLLLVALVWQKQTVKTIVAFLCMYAAVALLIPLPWFLLAFAATGNPVYPFFSAAYPLYPAVSGNPIDVILDGIALVLFSADPISPIYLIFLPVLFFVFQKAEKPIKLLLFYALLATGVWYLTPHTGGGRFLLPYLPIFSLLVGYGLWRLWQEKYLRFFCLVLICFIALVSIGYRAAANAKYLPVLLGMQSKDTFLTNNLNYGFGDFYDTDGYFKTALPSDEKVLLIGFHNLYYVNFSFVDRSWMQRGEQYNYIAVQQTELPQAFADYRKVYYNPTTQVSLYKRSEQRK